MTTRRIQAALGVSFALLIDPIVAAHEGPGAALAHLSEQIAAEGATAETLTRRADEWRAIGEPDHAAADYRLALALEPEYRAALLGWARCESGRKRFDRAERLAERGVAASIDARTAAPFHALLAGVAESRGDDEAALLAWRAALQSDRPEVDWLLAHARALQRLGRPLDARDALASARARNPSAVVERAWVDALIACGDLDAAAPLVEDGLARSRFKSSWLLMRAKLRSARHEPDGARSDAEAALHELERRRLPGAPNQLYDEQAAEARRLLAALDRPL